MSRKFNGLIYKEADAAPTKARAEAVAKTWRNKGYNARIVKNKNSYTIYVRKNTGKKTGSAGKKYTLSDIKQANKAAGHFFFSKDTMRFFRGCKHSVVRTADGTHYHKFNPKTGHLTTVSGKPKGVK